MTSLALTTMLFTSMIATASPFPIRQTRADEIAPRVAYDPSNDRYLVVWEAGGDVFGRFIHSSGLPSGAAFPIFWETPTESFSSPAVTFKSPENQFYVVAIATSTWTASDDVFLKILNADGGEVPTERRVLYQGRWGRNIPANLTIEADSYGSDCCILVAWSDDVTGDIDGTLISNDGREHQPVHRLVDASSGPAGTYHHPSSVYWRKWDRYVLAYEFDPRSGFNQIGVRSLSGYGSSVFSEVFREPIATRDSATYGDVPEARPRLAYNQSVELFLLTWYDRAPGNVDAHLMDWDGWDPVPYGSTFTVSRAGRGLDGPAPVAVDTAPHFVVYHAESTSAGNAVTVGTRVTDRAGGPLLHRVDVSGSTVTPRGRAGAGYSTRTGSVLATWHEFTSRYTNANDIWGAVDRP